MEKHELVIVGAGPAGIAAGVRAKREGIDVLVIEKDEPLWIIREVYPEGKPILKHPPDFNMPDDLWFENMCSKEEFIRHWEKPVSELGDSLHTHETVVSIKKANDRFVVKTTKSEYQAKFVVLAIGMRGRPRKLGVPGEELEKVSYSLKNPGQYKGKKCLVVGGGDTAAETAILLAQAGADVTISYRRERFFRLKEENLQKIEELENKGIIRVVFNSNVTRIGHKTVWLSIKGKDEELMIDNDYVFVCIGSIPNKEFLSEMGLKLDNTYKPVVDENMETNIKGIFVIGDLSQTPLITHAVNSGWQVIEVVKERMKSEQD